MKYLIKWGILLFLLLPNVGLSSHMAGADIGWEWVNKDTLRINLSILRDCKGTQIYDPKIDVTSTCFKKVLTLSKLSESDITPTCSEQCTRCSSGGCTFSYGIQKSQYSTLLAVSDILKGGCCQVTLSLSFCCRQRSITTGSSGENFYIASEVNVCQPGFDSPTWRTEPAFLYCLNQDQSVDFGVKPMNASDSISLSIDTPKTGPKRLSRWSGKYGYDNPIAYYGFPNQNIPLPRGFHFDSITGRLAFRPLKEEISIFKTKASIYRKGKLVGYVKRESVQTVLRCPSNNVPTISRGDCKGPTSSGSVIQACTGQPLCFDFCISDTDSSDTVRVTGNTSISKASLSVLNKGSERESMSFCWTPDSSDIRETPYFVSVTAYDDACPIPGKTTEIYRIYVNRAPVYEKASLSAIGCGKVRFVVKNKTGQLPKWHQWASNNDSFSSPPKLSNDTFIYSFKNPGLKKVNFVATDSSGCKAVINDSVLIASKFIKFEFSNDTLVCEGATLTLRGKVTDSQGKFKVRYSTGDSATSALSSTQFTAGKSNAFVTAHFSDQHCGGVDTAWVLVNKLPNIKLPETRYFCNGDSLELESRFIHHASERDTQLTYEWYKDGKALSGLNQSSIVTKVSGLFTLEATDSLGCVGKDSTTLFVKVPRTQFPTDTAICEDQHLKTGVPNNPNGFYRWIIGAVDTNGFPKYHGDSMKHFFRQSGKAVMLFTDTTNRLHCPIYFPFKVNLNPLPKVDITRSAINLCQGDSIELSAKPSGGFWKVSGNVFTSNPVQIITSLSDLGQQTATYFGTNSKGCTNVDSVFFQIAASPNAEFTMPDSLRKGEAFEPVVTASPVIYFKYSWFVGQPSFLSYTGSTPKMNIQTTGTYPINLQVKNTRNGCTGYFTKENVVVYLPTSTELQNLDRIRLFPNPVNDQLTIINPYKTDLHLSLYNMTGAMVKNQWIDQSQTVLDVGELLKGMYIVRLQSGEDVRFQQLMVE